MLTIRAAQKEVLARASFQVWLLGHVRRYFEEECAELGAEATLAFIRALAERARQHGLSAGPEICSYVDLAFTFGRDFETSPWANGIVSQAAGRWNEFTLDALFEAAMAELESEDDGVHGGTER